MRAVTLLKFFVRKASTRRAMRETERALSEFMVDFGRGLRHGEDLRRHCKDRRSILLNVGCGTLIRDGWVNIDREPQSGVFYFNALDPLPIADSTVSHINTEHFLEHLEFEDGVRFLGECYRVLSVGGTMRIVVPDAERYMRAYVQNDVQFFEQLKDLGGSARPHPSKDAICNQMFRMAGAHRFAWDFETLELVAKDHGFRSIHRSMHNDPDAPYCIDGQDWWRPVESLYANLQK